MNMRTPTSYYLPMRWNDGVRSGLASWLRGRASLVTSLYATPAWTRSGEGTPPIPPPPRPFFTPVQSGLAARCDAVEPRLRHLVADTLGMAAGELTADVSLVDDLAADSLDLLEVAISAEEEFGIVIRERTLAAIRTFGDLVQEVGRLVVPERAEELPEAVWARVVPPDSSPASLERGGALTPYLAQTITEDAVHAGPGTRVEVTVPARTGPDAFAAVQAQFAPLEAHGVEVRVRRKDGPIGVFSAASPAATRASAST